MQRSEIISELAIVRDLFERGTANAWIAQHRLEAPGTPFEAWLVQTGRLHRKEAEFLRAIFDSTELECMACGETSAGGEQRRAFAELRCPACGKAGTLRQGGTGAEETETRVLLPGDPPPAEELPRTIGPWQVVREVGRGGFGVVVRAWNPSTGELAAIKVLSEHADDEMRQRFHYEAAICARLEHPNLVRVIDYGEDRARAWLAMEWIEGESLEEHVRAQGPMEPAAVARVGIACAGALQAAHAAGIVHRDVKPANVIRMGDSVRLIDFGVAKLLDAPSRLTRPGFVLGTPMYMSPEQAAGEAVDAACDVYSLGATLWFITTSQPPRPVWDPGEDGRFPPLRQIRASAPVALERIVWAMTAEQPGDRPDLETIRQDLAKAMRAKRPTPATNSLRPRTRKRIASGSTRHRPAATASAPPTHIAPVPPQIDGVTLEEILTQALAMDPVPNVVLDCSGCTAAGPDAVAGLKRLVAALEEAGVGLVIARLTPRLLAILRGRGASDRVPVAESMDAAMRILRNRVGGRF